MRVISALLLGCTIIASAAARADMPEPYAPYAFLIGEWDVGAECKPASVVARFRWGPNQSYMWYSVSTLRDRTETLHFEGILVYNGVRRTLDMLLTLDPVGGRVQEQGSMHVAADGTVVRDIVAYYAEGARMPPAGEVVGSDGATVRFRQTFKASSPDKVLTSLTRETGEGSVPTFPGSENLVMTRRTPG